MKKIVKLTESDLNRIVKKVLNEQYIEDANYMFFSNLKQMKRQIEMIMEMDKEVVNEIIINGHDWADDHISEAKTNIDQVFDFLKNPEQNFVLEVNPLQRQSLMFILQLMQMDMRFKFVKEQNQG